MKKQLLLAGVAVVALIGSAPSQAADLGLLKAPPKPAFSWTGCYVGGHIGFGVGNKEFSDQPGGNSLAGVVGDGAGTGIAGFLGGGQIGCNYQFANNWVFGIEGAGSGANINGSEISPFSGKSLSARTDWLASVTGRLGYSVDQWLFYVKGGAAWAGDHFQVAETGVFPNTYGLSQTRLGATAGMGAEYAFWGKWSVRVEYNFYAFGNDSNLTFGCSNPVSQTFCGVPATRGPETIKQDINQFTVGLNYRIF
jgi:outer membrane immunogenic protein